MYVLVLFLFIQSTTALITCRLSCTKCQENMEPPELLEVYCSMCEECRERRENNLPSRRDDTCVPIDTDYCLDQSPENCPPQPACSDYKNEPLTLTERISTELDVTTTETTTTTTPETTTTTISETTTRAPFRPCKRLKKCIPSPCCCQRMPCIPMWPCSNPCPPFYPYHHNLFYENKDLEQTKPTPQVTKEARMLTQRTSNFKSVEKLEEFQYAYVGIPKQLINLT